MQRAGGALEAARSFTRVSRSRFANRSHQLNPRPCQDETLKVCPGEGSIEQAQRQRQGRGGEAAETGYPSFPVGSGRSRVPAVGWGGV